MSVDPHRLAELRSLAYHEELARRIAADAEILEMARRRVDGWLASGDVSEAYAAAWRDLLTRPAAEIAECLVDPGERMTALRQSTPFAGALDPRTRWALWRKVRDDVRTAP